MTPEGCGALVYVDETNRAVRFAIFTKGKWSTETVFQDANTGGYISDVSLAFDSEGGPLISVSAYSDMELMYFVKSEENGLVTTTKGWLAQATSISPEAPWPGSR